MLINLSQLARIDEIGNNKHISATKIKIVQYVSLHFNFQTHVSNKIS